MNQQPLVNNTPEPSRAYTEEEQRLRWALIIEAILHDVGPSPPIVTRPIKLQPVTQSRQAV